MGESALIAFVDLNTDVSTFAYLGQSDKFLGKEGPSEIYAITSDSPGVAKSTRELFLEDFSYLTSIQGIGYALIMDETPWIAEIKPGVPIVRRLEEFPVDFRSCPKLERNPDWNRTPEEARRMAAWQHLQFTEQIRDARMPAGLFTLGNEKLVLLAKDAMAEDGTTEWWLIQVDPTSGAEMSRTRIPSVAPHINIIAGDAIAVIEKGPLELLGDPPGIGHFREINSMVVFPSTWLESKGLGIKAGEPIHCKLGIN